MSAAPAESTMSGGNAADNSRLGQPSDAVPMENMPQTPDGTQEQPTGGALAGPSSTNNTSEALSNANLLNPDEHEEAAAPKGKDGVPIPPSKERQDSGMAIGPAQDDIKPIDSSGSDGLVCNITLLLTTGSRHPYKIDGKYLSRRNVTIPEDAESGQPDPFSISIYTLKELILREWRSDWETKPASPSSIRLIHFGKLLDDKEPLKKYQFSMESPNVVHMSVRPQDLDEEEPKSGSKHLSSGGADGARTRSGGCCVIL